MGAVMLARPGEPSGWNVSNGEIVMPRAGAWHADLAVDSDQPLTGAMEIRIGTAGTLAGTIDAARSQVVGNIFFARVVAGGNGLRTLAKAKHYTGPSVKLVLGDLLRDAGETLAADASSSVLSGGLEHWTTIAIPTGRMIGILLKRAPGGELVWRAKADGSIWCGVETWPASGIEAIITAKRPQDALLEVGLPDPFLLPGTTIREFLDDGSQANHKVDTAQIKIAAGGVSTKVWLLA